MNHEDIKPSSRMNRRPNELSPQPREGLEHALDEHTTLTWLPSPQEGYCGRLSVVLGAILVTCGLLSIIAHSVGLAVSLNTSGNYLFPIASMMFLLYGIWCGVFFLLGGAFACVAGTKKSKGFIITSMVMCIIGAVFAAVQTGISITGILIIAQPPQHMSSTEWGVLAASCVLLLCGLTGLVTSIWSSVLACKVTCCRRSQPEVVVRYALVSQTGPGAQLNSNPSDG